MFIWSPKKRGGEKDPGKWYPPLFYSTTAAIDGLLQILPLSFFQQRVSAAHQAQMGCCPETIKHGHPSSLLSSILLVSHALFPIGTQVAERLLAWPCSCSVCWLGPPGSRCQDRVGSSSSLAQIMMLSCLVMSDSLRPPGSSVHGTFPTRILEWVTISPSRRSSWLKDQMASPVLLCFLHGRWILYH